MEGVEDMGVLGILVLIAVVVVLVVEVCVVSRKRPCHANHGGLRFEEGKKVEKPEASEDGSRGRGSFGPSLALPLQVLKKDGADVDRERHALALG
jgi:hypothetical protein